MGLLADQSRIEALLRRHFSRVEIEEVPSLNLVEIRVECTKEDQVQIHEYVRQYLPYGVRLNVRRFPPSSSDGAAMQEGRMGILYIQGNQRCAVCRHGIGPTCYWFDPDPVSYGLCKNFVRATPAERYGALRRNLMRKRGEWDF